VGKSIQQTSDGGYIIAGYTESFGAGGYDMWLIKADANGDTLWTKIFGGIERDEGNSVQQTPEGGYILTGYTTSFGEGSEDVWLIKTDVNGDTIWTKTFGDSTINVGNSAQQTSDGGYIITGLTHDMFGESGSDVWLIKTDTNGDTLWTKTFGGFDHNEGSSVQQTIDGGYIISGVAEFASFGVAEFAGYMRDSNGYLWLIKTDSTGDTLWTKKIGNNEGEWGRSVQQTTDGGYIIAGSTGNFSDIWLIRANGNGDTLWTKSFGESGWNSGYSVQQTTDGGYIITGVSKILPWGPAGDVTLIKVAPDVTSIDENPQTIISDFQLHQNYPNPFNPTTAIKYQIPEISLVTLKVYDVLGSEIATLVNEEKHSGSYEIEFNATTLPSGIYFYKLQAGSFVETKKMILMK
jgi:hypothetical protein